MANIYLAKYWMLETMSLYPKFGDWLLSISYFRTLNTKLILYKCDFPTVTRKNPSQPVTFRFFVRVFSRRQQSK